MEKEGKGLVNQVEDIVDIISDSDSEDFSDKPLIDLFKRLIGSENKQNTVMKNNQIYDLLRKEFDIDMRSLHVLEIDIYLTLIKKFLKDWPDWDNFDKIVNERRKGKSKDFIDESVLEKNYESMKAFLKKGLNDVQPLAKQAVKMVTERIIVPKEEEPSEGDIYLEIQYESRAQLKSLFNRHPNRKANNEVFNTEFNIPSQIKITTPSLRSILNWWDINITITDPSDAILYRRETKHEHKYILRNKRLGKNTPIKKLDQDLQFLGTTDKKITVNDLICFLNNAFAPFIFADLQDILSFIKVDLKLLPPKIFQDATYKRYTNKYPYVRYFYRDIENVDVEDIRKYDLQLEETMSPMYEIYLGNFSNVINNTVMLENSVKIQCMACSMTFEGKNIVSDLIMHFDLVHSNESAVKCTNCEEEFSVEFISGNWWCHNCKSTSTK